MSLFDAFRRGNPERKAMALYKRGMGKARQKDHDGAIADYTATIDMAHAPSGVKAMALYNRALVHAAVRDPEKAIADLKEVLGMGEAPPDVISAAGGKLQKISSRMKPKQEDG